MQKPHCRAVPRWVCRAPRGIPPAMPGRKPRRWQLRWSGNPSRASAASHLPHLWYTNMFMCCSYTDPPHPQIKSSRELERLLWRCRCSCSRPSLRGRKPSRTQTCWRGVSRLPGDIMRCEKCSKTAEHRWQPQRSQLTQWRSFRDWVCGGPPCHQLKPREETTSVTFPTAFNRACFASSAPSSDPATKTEAFQKGELSIEQHLDS